MANRCLEIRILRLHHGQREQFVARFRDQLLALHQHHGIEVVAWGLSLHDQGSFYVIRAYSSVEARQDSMDAFFGSDDASFINGQVLAVDGGFDAAGVGLPTLRRGMPAPSTARA